MGFGTFNINGYRVTRTNTDGWCLFVNNKYYKLVELYSSGERVKTIIRLDKTLTVDDLVYFISWEKSTFIYTSEVYKKTVLTTFNGNTDSTLVGAYPKIDETNEYIEIIFDYKQKM